MNPETLEIGQFENDTVARLAGFTLPLSSEEFSKLQGMTTAERSEWLNRHERRKAAALGKLEFPK